MSRTADDETPFWQAKALADMTSEEWEALCDGCGRCCLMKLEDEDTSEIAYTDIVCHLFDEATCSCTDYLNRTKRVPDCLKLTPATLGEITWMPATCAYRLLAEGEDLYWWHPLVSGERDSVHDAGISVRGRVLNEKDVPEEDLEDRIVTWPNETERD